MNALKTLQRSTSPLIALILGISSALLARTGMLNPILLIAALLYACGMARRGGAWLLLLTAIPTLFAIPAVPSTPGPAEWQTLAFFGAFTLFSLWEAYCTPRQLIPVWRISALFLLLFSLSWMIATARGVSLHDWLRGIVPFTLLWLMVPIALALQTDTAQRAGWIAASVGALALLICLDVNVTFFSEGLYTCYWKDPGTHALVHGLGCKATSSTLIGPLRGRVTMYFPGTTSELVVLGCVLFTLSGALVRSRILRNSLRLCALIALFTILESLTRSMFAAMLLGLGAGGLLIACCFRERLRAFTLSLLMLLVGGVLFIKAFDLEPFWMHRFAKMSATIIAEDTKAPADDNISIRLEEYRIAMRGFSSHPFTGTGIGSRHEILLGDTTGNFSLQSVGYIHNWVMYWLMVGGLPGFLLYAGLFAWPLWVLWKRRAQLSPLWATCCIALITMSAYGLFFAVFRLAGWNLLLALMMGLALRLQAVSSARVTSISAHSESTDCSSAPNCSS